MSSSSKPLTKELIVMKCKSDKLHSIKNVNLWGNDIDDVSVLAELPAVEIVSLSLNKISSLRDFARCPKLSEIYLRKNCIEDLREVNYLAKLPNLKVLWLSQNPCADHPYYRQYVVKSLPNLIKLDNAEITPDERQAAMNFNCDPINHS
jgi:cilla- and flagella-associated protein